MRSPEELGIIPPDQADIDRANQARFTTPSKLENLIKKLTSPWGRVTTATLAAATPTVVVSGAMAQSPEVEDTQEAQNSNPEFLGANVVAELEATTDDSNSFLTSLPLSDETKNNFLTPFLNNPVGKDLNPNIKSAPNYLGTQSFDTYDVHFFKALDGGKDVIIAGRDGTKFGKVYYTETTIFPDMNTPAFSEMNTQIIGQYGPGSVVKTGDNALQLVYLNKGEAFEYYDDPPRFAADPNSRFINKRIAFDPTTTPTIDEYQSGWAAKTYLVAARGK